MRKPAKLPLTGGRSRSIADSKGTQSPPSRQIVAGAFNSVNLAIAPKNWSNAPRRVEGQMTTQRAW